MTEKQTSGVPEPDIASLKDMIRSLESANQTMWAERCEFKQEAERLRVVARRWDYVRDNHISVSNHGDDIFKPRPGRAIIYFYGDAIAPDASAPDWIDAAIDAALQEDPPV